MTRPRNRFDDLAIHDRVRGTGLSDGREELLVTKIENGRVTAKGPSIESVGPESRYTFTCHNQGAPFTSYDKTAESGYADGYETGFNWNLNRWPHRPGGPAHSAELGSSRQNKCRHQLAYDRATLDHYNAWHKGYDAGRAARKIVPLDIKRPLFLDTGQPVEVISVDEYHVTVRLPLGCEYAHDNGSGGEVTAHIMSAVLSHNHGFYLRNAPMPFHSNRTRFGFHGSTPAYISQEEASKAFHKCAGEGMERSIFCYEQTQDTPDDPWRTTTVQVMPLIEQVEFYFYDMTMKLLTAEPTDASHVKVEQTCGIVSKVEIVHPE